MGVETGTPAALGGDGWYRNVATVPGGSAVKRPGCRERRSVSFIEPLLGCQTSLCLILLFFFFNLLSATLHMQSVSLEVSIRLLQAGRTYSFSKPQGARPKGFGIRIGAGQCWAERLSCEERCLEGQG